MKPMNYVLDNAGCYNELEFWSTYSGLSTANSSWVDHMVAALGKNGYSGTPGDMYRAWLVDMGGMINAPLNGLTFFKNYTSLGNGGLNATLSVGSGTATYTSTSGTPTMTGGYNATTANDDVLKYAIAGNRTAAQETIVIKFTPTGDFANDGVRRTLSATDTKVRNIRKQTTGTVIQFFPNATDSIAVESDSTTTPLDGVSYKFIFICQHASPYASVYLNGSSQSSYTSGDFTSPPWGTYFYIGSNNSGAEQLNGVVSSIALFNRPLSSNEISNITNLI